MKKTSILLALYFIGFSQVSFGVIDQKFVLKKTEDGNPVAVHLKDYDIQMAVPSPRGNYCAKNLTVTAWTAKGNARLIVDGKSFSINQEHSFGYGSAQDPFHYTTIRFFNREDCDLIANLGTNYIPATYVGATRPGMIASLALSFVQKSANTSTSWVDFVIAIDYQNAVVRLLKLRADGDMLVPGDWVTYAEGTL